MKVEQYVMAYSVEHDMLRSILPENYESLRPVLRINAEIRDESSSYVEFNTPIEKDGVRGWLNIGNWDNIPFVRSGERVTFKTDFLEISFSPTGIAGSCPAEKDNEGCFFIGETTVLRLPETISSRKEFCDCDFQWKFASNNAHGVSIGKTLSAYPAQIKNVYPRKEFTVKNAVVIPCEQVLGTYVVIFDR